jgi:drug/metabolite transporter (DMT)-like permease
MHDSRTRPISRPRPGLFWNPYLQIFLTVLLTSAAQILLKLGADGSAGDNSIGSWLGLRELGDGWTWLGIVAFVAFSLTNGVHILVPIGSWLFLHEKLGPLRISGIAVIVLGILLLAQSVAQAEEKV